MTLRSGLHLATCFAPFLLAACGESDPGTKTNPRHPTSAEVEATQAFRERDVDRTLIAWRRAIEEASVPNEPVAVCGGYHALFPEPTSGQESDEFLHRALDALENDRDAESVRLLLRLTTTYSRRIEGHLLAALHRLRRGEHRMARGFLARVPHDAAPDWRLEVIQAVTLFREGHDEAARRRLLRARSLAPEERVVAYYEAREHLRLGNEGAAQRTLATAFGIAETTGSRPR